MKPFVTKVWSCVSLIATLSPAVSASAQAITFTTGLYQFTGKSDGSNPIGGLIEDAAGTLYGETYTGGTTTCSSKQIEYNKGCGTVYSFSASGGIKVLATFTGPNGAHGNITLTLVGQTLYGATQQGGASDDGVVFSVNTDGSNYTLLHQFDGADGSAPAGNLVVAGSGTLYGITNLGGANNFGVLYSLTPTGAYKVLHTFALPTSVNPNALLIASNGMLVGSTASGGSASSSCFYGCGTVFDYVPATRKFTTVYTLPNSGAQGNIPFVGSIGPGPTIYVADFEEMFSLSQQAGFVPIAYFDYYSVGNGINSGPLYTPGGTLYGVLGGGQSAGGGALYSVQNGEIVDTAFMGSSSGSGPAARPYLRPPEVLLERPNRAVFAPIAARSGSINHEPSAVGSTNGSNLLAVSQRGGEP